MGYIWLDTNNYYVCMLYTLTNAYAYNVLTIESDF